MVADKDLALVNAVSLVISYAKIACRSRKLADPSMEHGMG